MPSVPRSCPRVGWIRAPGDAILAHHVRTDPTLESRPAGESVHDVQQMYIDGEWVSGERGLTFDVRDPATGDVVACVSDAGSNDARRAVAAAHVALRAWSGTSPAERARLLHAAASAMRERRDVLAAIITQENGKPAAEARGELDFAAGWRVGHDGGVRRIWRKRLGGP